MVTNWTRTHDNPVQPRETAELSPRFQRDGDGAIHTGIRLTPLFASRGENPIRVATAAAVIGGIVYVIALGLSFLLPPPKEEDGKPSSSN